MGVGEEKEAMRAEELLTENKSATDYSVMISRSTVLLLFCFLPSSDGPLS